MMDFSESFETVLARVNSRITTLKNRNAEIEKQIAFDRVYEAIVSECKKTGFDPKINIEKILEYPDEKQIDFNSLGNERGANEREIDHLENLLIPIINRIKSNTVTSETTKEFKDIF